MLAALGAAGGLALGLAGVRGLIALSTRQIPGMADASLNPAVLAFTTALALVTGLVFGLVPAIAVMRGNTNTLLKEDTARGSAGRGHRPDARDAGDRRNRAGAGAAGRRRAADQELRAAAGGESRLLGGQRADRAAGAAGDTLSGPRPRGARSGPVWSIRCAAVRRDRRRPDLERAVQRHGRLGLVLDRRLQPAAGRGAAARTAGGRRRRLLPRDADPARRRPPVHRRRCRGRPAGRDHRSVSGEAVLPEQEPARPADSPRRPGQPRLHDRRRGRHDQQHRSRRAGREGAALLSA